MKNIFLSLVMILIGAGGVLLLAPQMVNIGSSENKEKQVNEAQKNTATIETNKDSTTSNIATEESSVKYQQLTQSDVDRLIGFLNPQQKKAVLSDADAFARTVNQEAIRRALVNAAVAEKLDQNQNVAYLMQRQADEYLMNTYVRAKLASAALPEGFPSEEQIASYYENNKAQFEVAERVQTWQIFLHVPTNATEQQVAAVSKKAKELSRSIRKGKQSFSQAALQASQHPTSRQQGGYMGLIALDTLRPEVKEKFIALKPYKVSEPIRGATGFHIFRKGEKISGRTQPLEEVKAAIREILVKALRQQQRNQLIKSAATHFPANLSAEKLENWRLDLLTNIDK